MSNDQEQQLYNDMIMGEKDNEIRKLRLQVKAKQVNELAELSDDGLIEYFESIDKLWFDCEREMNIRMDKVKKGKRYWKLYRGIPERYD